MLGKRRREGDEAAPSPRWVLGLSGMALGAGPIKTLQTLIHAHKPTQAASPRWALDRLEELEKRSAWFAAAQQLTDLSALPHARCMGSASAGGGAALMRTP